MEIRIILYLDKLRSMYISEEQDEGSNLRESGPTSKNRVSPSYFPGNVGLSGHSTPVISEPNRPEKFDTGLNVPV